jgi:hypothetical protein
MKSSCTPIQISWRQAHLANTPILKRCVGSMIFFHKLDLGHFWIAIAMNCNEFIISGHAIRRLLLIMPQENCCDLV